MSPARGRDLSTALAARSFPRARRGDAVAVRDCARDAIDAEGLLALPRECVGLVLAGLRARAGVARGELRSAPWRAALAVLTLPLAAALLLVWTFGFVPRYDHWPLGEGWALLLGGSLVALAGAAFRRGWVVAGGALATFVAAVSPHFGFGTEGVSGLTPSFFRGASVDVAAASLLPTLVLAAGGLALPRRRDTQPPREGLRRLGLGLAPSLVALTVLLPVTAEPTYGWVYDAPGAAPRFVEGPPYAMPWLLESGTLIGALGVALAVALLVTWLRARERPADLLATGLVLASVAYPLVWVTLGDWPHPYWLWQPPYPLLLAGLPLLAALMLARRAGRLS